MKSPSEAVDRIKGLFNITVTPFGKDGSVDNDALCASVDRVLGIGFDGLLIGGTYGEFAAMNTDERVALFKTVVSHVGDKVPVLLCTAHSDSRVVFDLTELAGNLGGLPMVTAPYVSEVNDDHIYRFFERVSGISKTGIMIYNAPGIGITLSPELVCQLAEIDGMVALKQGDLNPTDIDILASRLHGKIRMLCASDLALLGPLAMGFDGVSSTNSCALPELIHSIYHAIKNGDAATAGHLQRLWYPLRDFARKYGQPQTTKAIMDLRGWRGGGVRSPLLDLDADQKQQVRLALEELSRNEASAISLGA
jgi:dihydrodipicolinate synthase/N-acetylneuraminate lyase